MITFFKKNIKKTDNSFFKKKHNLKKNKLRYRKNLLLNFTFLESKVYNIKKFNLVNNKFLKC